MRFFMGLAAFAFVGNAIAAMVVPDFTAAIMAGGSLITLVALWQDRRRD